MFMRKYESIVLITPDSGDEGVQKVTARLREGLEKTGGKEVRLEDWGVKRLAYEINKEVQGYYVYLNYAAPGKTVDEIERIFRIDDRVLRYLTVKLGEHMTAETIEAEKQRIADKAARAAAAEAEDAEGDESDDESADDSAYE